VDLSRGDLLVVVFSAVGDFLCAVDLLSEHDAHELMWENEL
jgi:hypothetical protein